MRWRRRARLSAFCLRESRRCRSVVSAAVERRSSFCAVVISDCFSRSWAPKEVVVEVRREVRAKCDWSVWAH